MIRSAVTISLVSEARGGPFVFWHDLPAACRTAKALGFDAIEVFPPTADAVAAGELRSLLQDNGLALAAVGTGAGWVRQRLHLCLPDASRRAQARDFVRSIIDFAGPLGAPAIIGSMQGRSGKEAQRAGLLDRRAERDNEEAQRAGLLDRRAERDNEEVAPETAQGYLGEALAELGAHAQQYKVPLLFEPLNRYETNMVNTLDVGVKLLRSLGTTNVLLLADLFHMNIEEVDIAEALRAAAGFVGHVHFVDSNRRPAGFGHLDYHPIAKALEETGYDRFASAEALPYPDPEGAAQQTIKAFRQYFRGV